MPTRRRTQVKRRTDVQVEADASAKAVAKVLGSALKDARAAVARSQRAAGEIAGMAHSTVAEAEKGEADDFTLRTWARLAAGAGVTFHAYLKHASAADQPRDAVHLKAQELLLRTAAPGGWGGAAELAIDDAARGSRSVDVALTRTTATGPEVAVLEVVDWLDDVGAALRDWTRRLARVDRLATARLTREIDDVSVLPRVSGCWVLRATVRNRGLVRDHGMVFRSRFPASGALWLRALRGGAPMPAASALLWVSVDGTRLWSARM